MDPNNSGNQGEERPVQDSAETPRLAEEKTTTAVDGDLPIVQDDAEPIMDQGNESVTRSLVWARRQLDRALAHHQERNASTTARKDVLHFLELTNGLLKLQELSIPAIAPMELSPKEAAKIGAMAANDKTNRQARNVPILQLDSDPEKKKGNHEAHANIHIFVEKFELALFAAGLDIEKSWKQHLSMAIVHSIRLVTWFNEQLRYKDATWAEAKAMIIKKFKAEWREPDAEEKLANMVARADEHPLHVIQDFDSIMVHHAIPDSKVYGNFLINALAKNHSDFVETIRSTYAASIGHLDEDERHALNVSYIKKVAPNLIRDSHLPTRFKKKGASDVAAHDRRATTAHTVSSNKKPAGGVKTRVPSSNSKALSLTTEQREEYRRQGKCYMS
ncbi:hypothetical protein BC940DRAFT_322045 [Gongronella butleri]|nr:hypothetical protein BC940DRAFT_322045 [Gongronella butleri]